MTNVIDLAEVKMTRKAGEASLSIYKLLPNEAVELVHKWHIALMPHILERDDDDIPLTVPPLVWSCGKVIDSLLAQATAELQPWLDELEREWGTIGVFFHRDHLAILTSNYDFEYGLDLSELPDAG